MNNMVHDGIVNTLSVNADGVLFSGTDAGSMRFFDYATGVPFQTSEDIVQPGSLDAEAGIFCSTFDPPARVSSLAVRTKVRLFAN